jgi:hypothetical protein
MDRPKARGRVSFSRFVPTTKFEGVPGRERFVTALPLKQPLWLRHRHCCLGRAASAPTGLARYRYGRPKREFNPSEREKPAS